MINLLFVTKIMFGVTIEPPGENLLCLATVLIISATSSICLIRSISFWSFFLNFDSYVF